MRDTHVAVAADIDDETGRLTIDCGEVRSQGETGELPSHDRLFAKVSKNRRLIGVVIRDDLWYRVYSDQITMVECREWRESGVPSSELYADDLLCDMIDAAQAFAYPEAYLRRAKANEGCDATSVGSAARRVSDPAAKVFLD